MIRTWLYLLLPLLLTQCKTDVYRPDHSHFVADYSMDNLPVSDLFQGPADMGLLSNIQIDEASGMVISRQASSLFWTHNDSGDSNRIFLVATDGTWKGTYRIQGTVNRDWEDIAMGPGPEPNVNYLYVGEIGDNRAQHAIKRIYRFPEPDVSLAQGQPQDILVTGAETIAFVYPDQKLMDAETLMIDPWNGDIYIVTKREMPVTVYRLPFPQATGDTLVAEKYGTLPFTWAVAGDISPDGREILIKTYDQVFLWTRAEGERMRDAFLRPPHRLHYVPEPQGEAIAFATDGSGYFTVSEVRNGVLPKVYFYKRNP